MSDMSSFDTVISDLEKAGSTPTASAAATTATTKSNNSFDKVINDLENFSVTPDVKEVKDEGQKFDSPAIGIQNAFLPKDKSQNAGKALLETGANLFSGIGASAIGGLHGSWRAMMALAKGKSLQEAVNEGAKVSQEEQQNRTYIPETEGGKNLSAVVNYPGELIAKGVEGIGNLTGKMGASPGVQTGIETALNAVPYALGFKGGKIPIGKMSPENAISKPDASTVLKQQFEKAKSPDVATEGKTLSIEDQNKRAQILNRVGVDEVHDSILKGEKKVSAGDFQESHLDTPGGDLFKQKFDNYKKALQEHTESIIKDTGGTFGLAEDDLGTRGSNIANVFDSIRDVKKSARDNFYKQADAAAEGAPFVKLDPLAEFLKKDSAFEGISERGDLRKGIRSYLKEQNIINPDGTMNPITVKSSEGLRQYINEQWSPKSSGLAGQIKGLIDKSIEDSAGDNIYGPARDLHKNIKETFDNPKGISKLMDYDPREPTNRAVPYEKIPDFITRLPTAQFENVINVLKTAPDELKPQATSALGEIKAHFMNKVLDEGSKHKGQWNSSGVSKFLDKSNAKFEMLFEPGELAKINDLNEAGKILNVDTGYKGAAAQTHNFLVRGASKLLPVAGAGAGSYFGGTAGAAVGAGMGAKLAGKIEAKSSLSSAQKRLIKISDMPGVEE